MDANGNFYFADYEKGLILQFDPSHTFIRSWGGKGTGDGQFVEVSGLAIAPDGTIYVSDVERDDIQLFDAEGNYLGTMGGPGTEPGQFMNPSGIHVDEEGNLWVANLPTIGSPNSPRGRGSAHLRLLRWRSRPVQRGECRDCR